MWQEAQPAAPSNTSLPRSAAAGRSCPAAARGVVRPSWYCSSAGSFGPTQVGPLDDLDPEPRVEKLPWPPIWVTAT